MLVLTRCIGQKLLIHHRGQLIAEIQLVEFHGESVRVGFDKMPDDVIVTRSELQKRFDRRPEREE